MYVDKSTRTKNGNSYTRTLLRRSIWKDGKCTKETVANISDCTEEEIAVIKTALKKKEAVLAMADEHELVDLRQGLSVGAVVCLEEIADRLGIKEALGDSREGKLALWQVIARIVGGGSRLQAVRLGRTHAVCDVLGLEAFTEDHLYENLDWLDQHQESIEKKLYRYRHGEEPTDFFLYDVTSSYLEGQCNDYAAFGYNRDGKKGKMQVVLGLLCDQEGIPVSCQVYEGNRNDTTTYADQVQKVSKRFGGGEITCVGDRGMIKGPQIEETLDHGFHYITGIGKAQIRSLIKEGVIQVGLFDEQVSEITREDGSRLILRRNPIRQQEIRQNRADKLEALVELAEKKTTYLQEHPRADEDVARRDVREKAETLQIERWVEIRCCGRRIEVEKAEAELREIQKLDGCYVLVTDLPSSAASKEAVHERYKDLTQVERAFRTTKGTDVELRPIFLRRARRTRAHALVCMLSYMIVQELQKCWKDLNFTVGEGVAALSNLCCTEVLVAGKPQFSLVPRPEQINAKLMKAAQIKRPRHLRCSGIKLDTRKKLQGRRKG